MSMVIPFSQCKARPDEDGHQFWLKDHLVAVAKGWGKADGSYRERLFFLGGLCHDVAKGRKKWQDNLDGPKGSRPPHAAPGALVYSFYAARILDFWRDQGKIDRNQEQVLKVVAVQAIRDIFDHHGELGDIEQDVPWLHMPGKNLSLHDLDLDGFHRFISGYIHEISSFDKPSFEIIEQWGKSFRKSWPRWANIGRVIPKLCSSLSLNKLDLEKKMCIRNDTARFISADRLHAARITEVYLEPKSAHEAVARLDTYCGEKAASLLKQDLGAQEIIERRATAQAQSLQQYRNRPTERFYALSLPTGLGKTLTSLRIALQACVEGRCHRIIYAAPYISILSQATNEIRNATGLEVLQHHHLSMLSEDEFDDKDVLIIESWQAPVVTTTFNQLFRALFPYRAQDLVRMPAMEKAFIIIDEPQIIDSTTWNLFLAQMNTVAQELDCQVLFISATLPPFEYAGIEPPYDIKTTVRVPSRYYMQYLNDIAAENDVAEGVTTALPLSVCAVMNTVRDAGEVYRQVKDRIKSKQSCLLNLDEIIHLDRKSIQDSKTMLFNLNGLMTPIHKDFTIDAISWCLQHKVATAVISTQIIEAGVDLSFHRGIRARAIHPSHIQFAGRVNRHGEGDAVAVIIMNFLRDGKMDSRKWVYTSSIEREETDSLLGQCDGWDEATSLTMLYKYYKATFERNPNTTLLNYYSRAAIGQWSVFAGIEPFSKWYPTISVFVPWPDTNTLTAILDWYRDCLPEKGSTVQRVLRLMARFGIRSVEEIYEKYVDREFRKSLDFVQTKQFMALLQQFLVSVGEKMTGFAYPTLEYPILCLRDANLYSIETGLAHLVGQEDREIYF